MLNNYQCQLSLPPCIVCNNKIKYKLLNEDNFIKGKLTGAIWDNNLIGHVRNHKVQYSVIPDIDWNKINLVDHICWINLDTCVKQRHNMEQLLKFVKIPNTRICGVDGLYVDNLKVDTKNMTKGEIGCTLSHIKTISY